MHDHQWMSFRSISAGTRLRQRQIWKWRIESRTWPIDDCSGWAFESTMHQCTGRRGWPQLLVKVHCERWKSICTYYVPYRRLHTWALILLKQSAPPTKLRQVLLGNSWSSSWVLWSKRGRRKNDEKARRATPLPTYTRRIFCAWFRVLMESYNSFHFYRTLVRPVRSGPKCLRSALRWALITMMMWVSVFDCFLIGKERREALGPHLHISELHWQNGTKPSSAQVCREPSQ